MKTDFYEREFARISVRNAESAATLLTSDAKYLRIQSEPEQAKVAGRRVKASDICWTPCKHVKQCMGFCPLCLAELQK